MTHGESDQCSIDAALESCREAVRRKSIRIAEFFVDFDRLRSGLVHRNQFTTALGIAGIDKALQENELEALKGYYLVKGEGNLQFVDYREFCKAINNKAVRNDWAKRTNASQALSVEQETRLNEILSDMTRNFKHRGILVKPMFVDFAQSNNSSKLVGHVTRHQFHRTIDVKLGIKLSEEDIDLLHAKYSNPDYKEMVNYVQFANDVIPEEKPFNPYTEA